MSFDPTTVPFFVSLFPCNFLRAKIIKKSTKSEKHLPYFLYSVTLNESFANSFISFKLYPALTWPWAASVYPVLNFKNLISPFIGLGTLIISSPLSFNILLISFITNLSLFTCSKKSTITTISNFLSSNGNGFLSLTSKTLSLTNSLISFTVSGTKSALHHFPPFFFCL